MTRPRNILLLIIGTLFSPVLALAALALIATVVVHALLWRELP